MIRHRCAPVFAIFVFCSFLQLGCGPSEKPTAPVDTTEISVSSPPATEENDAGNDPARELQTVLTAIVAGQGDLVVEAIPISYREDLDRFLSEQVRTLEPSTRRDLADAVADLARTVRQKKGFVLGSDRIELEGPAAGWIRSNFNEATGVLERLAAWTGWSDDEKLSASSVLQAAVDAIAAHPERRAGIMEIRISTRSRSADRAVVVLHVAEDKSHDLEVVKVDGRWIPAALAHLRDRLQSESRSDANRTEVETQLRELAKQLQDISAALAAVSNQADFDAAADRATTLLLATAAQAEEAKPRKIEPSEYVTVVVEGTLTEQQKDEILWSLALATDTPQSALADAIDHADRRAMVANVGPVADVPSFAERLESLTIVDIDAKKKTITARLKTP